MREDLTCACVPVEAPSRPTAESITQETEKMLAECLARTSELLMFITGNGESKRDIPENHACFLQALNNNLVSASLLNEDLKSILDVLIK